MPKPNKINQQRIEEVAKIIGKRHGEDRPCRVCREIATEIETYYSQLFPQPTDEALEKKFLASLDDCYLEVGTHTKNIVSRQALPLTLRRKIYEKALALLPSIEEAKKQIASKVEKQIWKSLYITPDHKPNVIMGIRQALADNKEEEK